MKITITGFSGTPENVTFYFSPEGRGEEACIKVGSRALRNKRIIYTIEDGCPIGLSLFPIGTVIETTDGFMSFTVKET